MKCRYCGQENDINNIKCIYCHAFLREIDELKDVEEKNEEKENNTKESHTPFFRSASKFRLLLWGSIIFSTVFCSLFIIPVFIRPERSFSGFDIVFAVFPIVFIIVIFLTYLRIGKRIYGNEFKMFGKLEEKK